MLERFYLVGVWLITKWELENGFWFVFFVVDRSNNCECSRYRTHSRASWVPSSQCYATILIIYYLVGFSENYSPLGLGDLVRKEQSEVSHPTTHLNWVIWSEMGRDVQNGIYWLASLPFSSHSFSQSKADVGEFLICLLVFVLMMFCSMNLEIQQMGVFQQVWFDFIGGLNQ